MTIRRHRRAKHYTLSYNSSTRSALLTVPVRASLKAGLAFAQSRVRWLQTVQAGYPPREHFYPGVCLPVLGELVTFLHRPGRGVATRNGADVMVYGDLAFFSRRVRDWIHAALARALRDEVDICLARLGYAGAVRIRIRSMSSRWGSCSSRGTLAFSSRLAFAPRAVVRYLAAHECAHLRSRDHSPAFWAWVRVCDPEYGAARAWLRTHGASLSRFE